MVMCTRKYNSLYRINYRYIGRFSPKPSVIGSGHKYLIGTPLNSSFSCIYQGERPYPNQPKSFIHYLSLNSWLYFTIVMLFQSFLWRKRHWLNVEHSDWSHQFLVIRWYIRSIPDPYVMQRGGRRQTSYWTCGGLIYLCTVISSSTVSVVLMLALTLLSYVVMVL